LTDRHDHRAWGLEGGGEGAPGMTLFQAAGSGEWQTMVAAFNKRSTSKWSNVVIKSGDRIQILTPGGGGWGDTAERDAAAVADDVAEGWISESAAASIYGADN
jgi:N-methylhydantoinase B/oxoprolinase/acetone carboxylase alpha subunit